MLAHAFKGTQHFWVEPDPDDPTKPSFRRRWPWPDMEVGDWVHIPVDEMHLSNTASVSAYAYAKRHGMIFKTGPATSGFYIWRAE